MSPDRTASQHAERSKGTARGDRELTSLAWTGVQLLAVLWLLRQFEVGGASFERLTWVILLGFPLHALLPPRLRLRCFVLLSAAGAVAVLGWVGSAWLATIAAGLILAARLPGPHALRVGTVMALASTLALFRSGVVAPPIDAPGLLWPVVGTLFMFRLPIYLYDTAQQSERPTLGETLAYFLMLPNPAFPLFPVVDFQTMRRSYYSRASAAIYRSGVVWMVRGLVHLLLYRAVYHHLVLAPEEVVDLLDLARFLGANFLLYLQVSGLFHLITGILHLFGFDLPPTHTLYFLSPSVSEFWRRANTYWRDFQLKLVYYPALLRLRRFGLTGAVAGATVLVFVATWALHQYQLFWLRGNTELIWQDAAFWGALGLLVLTTAIRQTQRPRERARPSGAHALSRTLLGTPVTFTVLAILWSLWTCSSWAEWLTMWRVDIGVAQSLMLLGGLAALGLTAVAVERLSSSIGGASRQAATTRRGAVALAPLAALLVVAMLPESSAGLLRTSVAPLTAANLHPRDLERLEDGYYEKISGFGRFDWSDLSAHRSNFNDFAGRSVVQDLRGFVFKANLDTEFKGRRLTTNSRGLRDREYTVVKPEGVVRFALLGPSPVAGSGVTNKEIFEALVEDRLERERNSAGPAVEILNFAVPGDGPLAALERLRRDVLRFAPDAVVYVATAREFTGSAIQLRQLVDDRIPIPYPFLARRIERSGIESGLSQQHFRQRLRPFESEIVSWTYETIVRVCRRRGIRPIWVYLDRPRSDRLESRAETESLATAAGFRLWQLADVYQGYPADSLTVSTTDSHPNALAHRLIADRFYDLVAAELESLADSQAPSSPARGGGP